MVIRILKSRRHYHIWFGSCGEIFTWNGLWVGFGGCDQLLENISFVWSKTSYSGNKWRCYQGGTGQTTERTRKDRATLLQNREALSFARQLCKYLKAFFVLGGGSNLPQLNWFVIFILTLVLIRVCHRGLETSRSRGFCQIFYKFIINFS